VKGAAASALARSKMNIAKAAAAQAMLLPPEIFKRRDGTAMTDTEVNRCMVMIKTIDNCLRMPGRSKRDYSEGLIADAADVAEKHPELREFYVWLSTNHEHPAVPKTTEQVLADFERVFAMVR
jgi:hypothetical protein